jgi:hypothetical protein
MIGMDGFTGAMFEVGENRDESRNVNAETRNERARVLRLIARLSHCGAGR